MNRFREGNSNWKGGKIINGCGYKMIYLPDHPRAQSHLYVLEHILIAEKVFGKPLPDKAEIHHVNEIKDDNRNGNIVICQDNAYHTLLHQRKRAVEACGHANWRKCVFCKEYDDLCNIFINIQGIPYHKNCSNKYRRELKNGS